MKKYDTFRMELEYPQVTGLKYIKIDLCDVRASDGIRISYDFERDGWKIEQPSCLEWESNDNVCDEKYKESMFIPSWQFIKFKEEDEET